MSTNTRRRPEGATLLGGALVVTPIVLAPAATAGPIDTGDCGYALPGRFDTSASIDNDGGSRKGEANATFTASTETRVTVEYSGVCVGGSAVAGSSGFDTPDVLGISGADSGPGGTGLDTQTELYGLLGPGPVAVGGMTPLVHRRRVQA